MLILFVVANHLVKILSFVFKPTSSQHDSRQLDQFISLGIRVKTITQANYEFSFSSPTLLVGRQEWHLACKKWVLVFGGDNLTGALRDL